MALGNRMALFCIIETYCLLSTKEPALVISKFQRKTKLIIQQFLIIIEGTLYHTAPVQCTLSARAVRYNVACLPGAVWYIVPGQTGYNAGQLVLFAPTDFVVSFM